MRNVTYWRRDSYVADFVGQAHGLRGPLSPAGPFSVRAPGGLRERPQPPEGRPPPKKHNQSEMFDVAKDVQTGVTFSTHSCSKSLPPNVHRR
jgi:hypothetical protein